MVAAGATRKTTTNKEKDGLLPTSIRSSDKQWTTPAAAADEEPHWALCALLLLLLLLVFISCVLYLLIGAVYVLFHWQRYFGPFGPVEYSVTIAAVSGLDAATDLRRPTFDPAFNLTLHVSSPRTAEDRECVVPGTTVEVSYLPSGGGGGVPLGTGRAPAFCVDVGEVREHGSVVAWGDGVRLPGFVLESLAADVIGANAEFEVRITPPFPYCGDYRFCSDSVNVISCAAKVGGGPAKCSVSKERVSFPPVPRPGGARDRDSAAAAAANLPKPTKP